MFVILVKPPWFVDIAKYLGIRRFHYHLFLSLETSKKEDISKEERTTKRIRDTNENLVSQFIVGVGEGKRIVPPLEKDRNNKT